MTEVRHKDDIFALSESQYDVAKLTDYYAKATEGSQRILPKEKRRYVMYLRKSTDDEAKQVRSLEEQLKVDKAIAQRKVAEARLDLKKEQNNYSKYQILQRDDPEAHKKRHKGKLEEQQ